MAIITDKPPLTITTGNVPPSPLSPLSTTQPRRMRVAIIILRCSSIYVVCPTAVDMVGANKVQSIGRNRQARWGGILRFGHRRRRQRKANRSPVFLISIEADVNYIKRGIHLGKALVVAWLRHTQHSLGCGFDSVGKHVFGNIISTLFFFSMAIMSINNFQVFILC